MEFLHLFRDWDDIQDYSPRKTIFSERDSADAVFVILEGEVELLLRGEPLETDGPGGVIGEMAVIEAGRLNATARARTRVKAARLTPEQFHDLMGRHPKFAVHVMKGLANRLRSVDAYISRHLGEAGGPDEA